MIGIHKLPDTTKRKNNTPLNKMLKIRLSSLDKDEQFQITNLK